YRGALEARAAAIGITDRDRFTGVVAPAVIPRWYRMGDVSVGASLSETQGLTFIEAMSSGLPLLCRRAPSLASVAVEGVRGWQFESPAQFTTRLNALLDDPRGREQMSRAALDRARITCDAQEFGRSVLSVYQQARGRREPLIVRHEPVPA